MNVDDEPEELFPDAIPDISETCPYCDSRLLTDGESKWCTRMFACQWNDADPLTNT